MTPRRFRFCIATWIIVVALSAVDIIWLRRIFGQHRSVSGFAAEGYDTRLFLMVH